MPLEIKNVKKVIVPDTVFEAIKDSVIGKKYDLSLVFVGKTTAQKLNKTYRDKTYVPDILSFPLSIDSGEIFICLEAAKRKMKEFDREDPTLFAGDFDNFLIFLFIHGLLHLKGMSHGSTMEKVEKKYFKKWQKKRQLPA